MLSEKHFPFSVNNNNNVVKIKILNRTQRWLQDLKMLECKIVTRIQDLNKMNIILIHTHTHIGKKGENYK